MKQGEILILKVKRPLTEWSSANGAVIKEWVATYSIYEFDGDGLVYKGDVKS